MARFLKNREKTKGESPGSLIFVGRKKVDASGISCISYNKDVFREQIIKDVDELKRFIIPSTVTWINLYGLQDIQLVERIGELFSIDPLALEDILNTDERPKLMEYRDQMVVIMKTLFFASDNTRIKTDQVSLVIGRNYVISFQEAPANLFTSLRERLRWDRGIIRSSGPDYLAYSIMDTLVDNYIINMEKIGLELEAKEEAIIMNDKRNILEEVYQLKADISFIRKSIRPVKEITINLLKTNSPLIQSGTVAYVADLDDHLTQAIEAADIYYGMAHDLMSLYHNNLGNRTNEVMKILTIFAAIFIPLTFVAGVYGTNFDYLPELHFRFGYFAMLGGMLLVAIIMLIYFKRKGWW